MRRFYILLLLFAAGSALPVFGQSNKGKLFIIGGGERTLDMVKRMVQESGLDKGGYAVVLPM